MSTLKIKFADGNELTGIHDDTNIIQGCPTCGYGTEYINEITITTTHHTIEATFNNAYGFAVTIGDMILMLASCDYKTITEEGFVKYICKEFHSIEALEEFHVVEK